MENNKAKKAATTPRLRQQIKLSPRKAARMEGKAQRAGIKPVRKAKRK